LLTRTSLSALRTLVYLGLRKEVGPLPLREIAEALKESPTYLAKVTGHLVRARVLRAHRGVLGGVTLARAPDTITLLSVVEACQGDIVGNFCSDASDPALTCAFHQAGLELYDAVVRVLSKWTLADLLRRPFPTEKGGGVPCWIEAGSVIMRHQTGVLHGQTAKEG
jgi:Rrf2 family transcriptional regulator, nitric oxide-sensitive transcriptional repressor